MSKDDTERRKKRLLPAVARAIHERACLLRPQGRSTTAQLLETDFGWRFVGRAAGASAEVPHVHRGLCCAGDWGRNFGFDCSVFARRDDWVIGWIAAAVDWMVFAAVQA